MINLGRDVKLEADHDEARTDKSVCSTRSVLHARISDHQYKVEVNKWLI